MWFTLLAACQGPPPDLDDGRAYAEALSLGRRDREAARARCADVREPALHADCITALAEAAAGEHETEAATALCAALPAGVGQDECRFQVAERGGAPELCREAGRFAEDCRMHMWSQSGFQGLLPGEPGLELEGEVARRAAASGFTAEDERPWIAFFRALHASGGPIDLGRCEGSAHRDLCRAAGVGLYNDLLNHARDSRTWPCEGEALPPRLEHRPDPEIEALIEARRGELCPPAP